MRRTSGLSTVLFLLVCVAAAQERAPLPVRKVVLYKSGIGYFEHLGEVRDKQDVEIVFPSSQLNDVLKSLTVIDLGRGQVAGVTYDSAAPLERRLAELPVKLDAGQGLVDFLNQLRGAEVEIRTAAAPVAGKLMGAEVHPKKSGENITFQSIQVSVFTPQGEVRTVELPSASALRLVERELATDLRRYLELLGSAHQRDVRRLKIHTSGTGARQLYVSYISESPVWKTTYRIVLDEKQKPLLQGWAIVDNTTPTDWTNVELSLVAGAPVSFVQNLSQPLYARRPVVSLPAGFQLTPQTHQATLELPAGQTGISGTVKDPAGAAIPGATVIVTDDQGETVGMARADANGRYRIQAPPGTYSVQAVSPGFQSATGRVEAHEGRVTARDFTLAVGQVAETVPIGGAPVGTAGGVIAALRAAAPRPAPPTISDAMREFAPETAQARALGEQFEYKLRQPVTIRRNQSALLPIVHTNVEGEKVSLYNEAGGEKRPRLAVWMTNSSALTLDSGSFTVIDSNAFAGEGLMETINPQERRLLSYALDLGLEVTTARSPEPERVERLEISRGVLRLTSKVVEKKVYLIRNNDEKPRTVVVEHPVRPGWTLTESARPAESSAGYHRYRVETRPKTTTELVVLEENPRQTTYALSNVTPEQITLWVRRRTLDAEIERALLAMVAKKAEIDALKRQLKQVQDEQRQISNDQQRVRENLAKLGQSREETNLRQRYVRQLEQQEDRLEQIRTEQTRLQQEQAAAQKQLDEQMQNLTFERKL